MYVDQKKFWPQMSEFSARRVDGHCNEANLRYTYAYERVTQTFSTTFCVNVAVLLSCVTELHETRVDDWTWRCPTNRVTQGERIGSRETTTRTTREIFKCARRTAKPDRTNVYVGDVSSSVHMVRQSRTIVYWNVHTRCSVAAACAREKIVTYVRETRMKKRYYTV